MIIDSHQHFWAYNERDYGWMRPARMALARDYLPSDLAPLLQANRVAGTVLVQARQVLEETDWCLDLAERHPFIQGVVGWVDLCSPRLEEQLQRYTGRPKLKGVRHLLEDEPDDRFMLRPEFLRGIGLLGRYGLRYDIVIFPRHLPYAVELASRFPDQAFVLDHVAKPPIKSGQLSPWDRDLRRLAACTNVFCKLSGLVTEVDWRSWRPAELRPYMEVVLDAFGPERLMFGSDWPVSTLAAPYEQVLGLVLDFIAPLPAAQREAILAGNARRFYGLAGS
jgi:L-fuconolactonase